MRDAVDVERCAAVHHDREDRVDANSGTPLTFRSWSPFPAAPRTATDSFNLHVTLLPPDGQPPSLDADDENGIPGAPTCGPRLPLDLC